MRTWDDVVFVCKIIGVKLDSALAVLTAASDVLQSIHVEYIKS